MEIVEPVFSLVLGGEVELKHALEGDQVNRLFEIVVCLFGCGLHHQAVPTLKGHYINYVLELWVSKVNKVITVFLTYLAMTSYPVPNNMYLTADPKIAFFFEHNPFLTVLVGST